MRRWAGATPDTIQEVFGEIFLTYIIQIMLTNAECTYTLLMRQHETEQIASKISLLSEACVYARYTSRQLPTKYTKDTYRLVACDNWFNKTNPDR